MIIYLSTELCIIIIIVYITTYYIRIESNTNYHKKIDNELVCKEIVIFMNIEYIYNIL